jgi:phage repressor protein C with HTH and peptisase S24 domain
MVDNMPDMTLGDRIKKRLLALSMSQAKLAQLVGISPQAVGKIISGGTSHTAHLYKIARALHTTPEYLAGEADEPNPDGLSSTVSNACTSDYDDEDIVRIQEIDLAFGMGGTFLDVPVKEKPRIFSRTLLSSLTHANPSKIYMARGIGDSMAPTIHNDDIILIDASANTIRMSDQIWAFAYGDFGMIKRLRPMPDGGVKILSDNPAVSDETAYDGELHVIGKVVAIIRRMAS